MSVFKRLFAAVFLCLFTVLCHASVDQSKAHYAKWVQKSATKPITLTTAQKIVEAAYDSAAKYNLDPLLLLSIMRVESGFRPNVKNRYGASGLMQVVSRFHRDKIRSANIFNIKTNTDVGAQVLKGCFDRERDHFVRAISCYNGGAGKRYLKGIKQAYAEIQRTDIAMRFLKEMPVRDFVVLDTSKRPLPKRRPATYVASL